MNYPFKQLHTKLKTAADYKKLLCMVYVMTIHITHKLPSERSGLAAAVNICVNTKLPSTIANL